MTEERIVLTNAHEEKLIGILQKTESDDVTIICHGFRFSKESKPTVDISDALLKAGISTFRFDFSGNGESEGEFKYANYWREVEDLRTAVVYFSNTRNIPVRAIIGHSKGGNVVVLYASKYHDVPRVVNIAGRFDLKAGVEERLGVDFLQKIKTDGFVEVTTTGTGGTYRVTEESLMDRLDTKMTPACSEIDRNCKVLTIHGSSDEVTPVADAWEFDKVVPNHEVRIIEGADHFFVCPHTEELVLIIIEFLKNSV
ncbi:Esterase/lipase/thioesterase [Zostera marina]|uniref:Esterase/lipase/thioesterase n=1 Tax=Zostera marina TaxID=29655 RepID=A0A0K9PIW6_ZOSMR|nr:Esterase/lipase/thioesterase [Zostera marina]